MKNAVFQRMADEIMKAHDEGKRERATLLVQILHARIMNKLVQVADAFLSEVDPEGLIRRVKTGDDEDSDVVLQAEALGADSFDPTAPHENLNATLSEQSPINSNLKVVQGRPEHVSDLARR